MISKSLYLEKGREDNNNYIMENGGYLIYLYLIKKGYPSDNIAFFTGNPSMMLILESYNKKTVYGSVDDIYNGINNVWRECYRDKNDGNEAYADFVQCLDSMNISKVYKNRADKIDQFLEKNDKGGLKNLIREIQDNESVDEINYEDSMISRFHKANLQLPDYYLKKDLFYEHDIEAMAKWVNDHRTKENMTRWLIIDIANYITGMSDNELSCVITPLFNTDNNSETLMWREMKNAFSQMAHLLNGIFYRENKEKGISGRFFQAISTILNPYEQKIKLPLSSYSGSDFDEIRKMLVQTSKQARNYFAHNYFRSTISDNSTTLFLLLLVVLGLLDEQKNNEISEWVDDVICYISECKTEWKINNINYSTLTYTNDCKINDIYRMISSSSLNGAICANDCLDAFKKYRVNENKKDREDFCVFSLAAYIIKWFNRDISDDNSINANIIKIYKLSQKIVNSYSFPFE